MQTDPTLLSITPSPGGGIPACAGAGGAAGAPGLGTDSTEWDQGVLLGCRGLWEGRGKVGSVCCPRAGGRGRGGGAGSAEAVLSHAAEPASRTAARLPVTALSLRPRLLASSRGQHAHGARCPGWGGPAAPLDTAVSKFPTLLDPPQPRCPLIGMGLLQDGGPGVPGQGEGRTELLLVDECPRPQSQKGGCDKGDSRAGGHSLPAQTQRALSSHWNMRQTPLAWVEWGGGWAEIPPAPP